MGKNQYNTESLKRGIDACMKNIQIFQDAIRKEKETIEQYKFYIKEILKKETH